MKLSGLLTSPSDKSSPDMPLGGPWALSGLIGLKPGQERAGVERKMTLRFPIHFSREVLWKTRTSNSLVFTNNAALVAKIQNCSI